MVYLNNFRQAMQCFVGAWQQSKHPRYKQAVVELAWMEEMEIPEEIQSETTEGELFDWKREYRIAVRESMEEIEVEYNQEKNDSLEEWIEQQKINYRRGVGE